MFSWFGRVSFVPYSRVQDFAVHLRNGYLMGSKCGECGFQTFPPRSDCPECMSGEFEFVEYSGKGTVWTHTRIDAAPTGFDDDAPYTCVVVELEEGGRLLGWSGETLPQEEVEIDMEPFTDQIAELDWTGIQSLASNLGISAERILREQWLAQARELAGEQDAS